jgi:hypothetical protein
MGGRRAIPMPVERYRISTPTPAVLFHEHGKDELVMVPAGSLVEADPALSEKARLIEVFWEGKTVSMFTVDFRERAELVRGRAN